MDLIELPGHIQYVAENYCGLIGIHATNDYFTFLAKIPTLVGKNQAFVNWFHITLPAVLTLYKKTQP